MIYLCTNQTELFRSDSYQTVTPEEALTFIKYWKICQVDTETNGRDAHICKLLSVQLGNDKDDIRIVIDCNTVDIKLFKPFLESTFCIFQNGKFDLQFFYNQGIIIRKVYDTMIVEQLLHLGWPAGKISYSLKALCKKYLNKDIDKTVRGEIIWRGLDEKVILYAASDVTDLEQIMWLQLQECKKNNCIEGAKLECNFVPVIAYLEWCGIHLDITKWQAKMKQDSVNLSNAKKALDTFIVKLSNEGYKRPYKDDLGNIFYNVIPAQLFKRYVFIDRQGDLFTGFDLTPKVNINWSSSKQVVAIAKLLGFNTTVQDKKTGEDKDSVLEKSLKIQKGICDEFLKLYFDYQEYNKVVTSFGQGHLNAINPITGRIHTVYKQLGAASGRMSCGSQQPNVDLAKLKHIKPIDCTSPNIQQLPHDAITRACFTAEDGNLLIDCDWSAAEARLAGDIYNDQAIKDIFLHDIDSHSMYAKIFFKEELKDIDVHDVKKLRPDLRQLAKGPEFALNFGGGARAIMQSIGCTEDTANSIIKNYEEGFKGTALFAKKGAAFVKSHGYVIMNHVTGHKMYWWDWKYWYQEQQYYNTTPNFWEDYRMYHKGTGDDIAMQVKKHFKAGSKWERMARNAPTQGTCAIMLKDSQIALFNYIVNKGYFGKYKLCALVHDECLWEVPQYNAIDFSKLIESAMLNSAAKYCKSLPIPATAEINTHWVH